MLNRLSPVGSNVRSAIVFFFVLITIVATPRTATAQSNLIYMHCILGEAFSYCSIDPANSAFEMIPHPQLGGIMSISRDGDHIALVAGRNVSISNIASWVPTIVGTLPEAFSYSLFALNKDATKVAIGGSGLIVMDVATGAVTTVSTNPTGGGTSFLEWSPGGDKLIYGKGLQTAVFMRNADGSGDEVQLTTPGPNDSELAADWSLDGKMIVVHRFNRTDETSHIVQIDVASGENTIINVTPQLGHQEVRGIEISPDGQRIAFQFQIPFGLGWESTLSVMPINGGGLTQLYSYQFPGGLQTRAFMAGSLEWTGVPQELIVNSTGDEADVLLDGVCDSDANVAGRQCTLRAAIQEANGLTGRDSVSFAIASSPPHIITLTSSLPVSTGPIVLDATTQSGYNGKPVVSLVGSGAEAALTFSGGTSTARGFSIGGFTASAVIFNGAEGNRIESSHIGLDAAGTKAVANGVGVSILNSKDNVVGGKEAARKNLISGNTNQGIIAGGTGATGNRIIGNWIGLDVTGEILLSNGAAAIGVTGDAGNIVIGESGHGNSIAADGHEGVAIKQDNGSATGAKVVANIIGFNASGTKTLGDVTFGVSVSGATPTGGVKDVQVGGESAADGNLIDASFGISIVGDGSTGAKVSNNKIGLLKDGTLAKVEPTNFGILILRANGALVTDNVIGGQWQGLTLAASNTMALGNKIGVDPTGELARANVFGVSIPRTVTTSSGVSEVGSNNVVGASGRGNTISGNSTGGILIGATLDLTGSSGKSGKTDTNSPTEPADYGWLPKVSHSDNGKQRGGSSGVLVKTIGGYGSTSAPPSGNIIAFNRIGTNSAGNKEIGNARGSSLEDIRAAVRIVAGTNHEIRGNLISGNGAGIQVEPFEDDDPDIEDTRIIGNVIGGSTTAGERIPNQFGAIQIRDVNRTFVVAGPLETSGPIVRNKIYGDANWGIRVTQTTATTIRQTDILGVDGPAISDYFRFDVHDPPKTMEAVANSGSVSLQITSAVNGPVDLFVSNTCKGGHASGTYVKTVNGVEGIAQSESISYADLPGNGASGAIGLWLSATVTSEGADAETSTFSECIQIVHPSDAAKVVIDQSETGLVADTLDITIDVTTNNSTTPTIVQTVQSRTSDQAATQVDSDLAKSWRSGLFSDSQSPAQDMIAVIPAGFSEERPSVGGVVPVDSPIAKQSEQSNQSGGTLFITRVPRAPIFGPIEGTAVSPSGTSVEPNTVSIHRSWTLRSNDLVDLTYSACLDYNGIGGVVDPMKLVVAHRPLATEPWTSLDTTLDGTVLCAGQLTTFGDLAIATDSLVNPFHVQVGTEEVDTSIPSTALTLSNGYPNPFGISTQFDLSLGRTGIVTIDVYDAVGRHVESLHHGSLPAGRHAMMLDAARLTAGIYFVRVAALGEVRTQAVTVIR